MLIKKVITGGQHGADLAAWEEARNHGIPVGGVMPAGYMTIDGPRPEYAGRYGAVESRSQSYPARTRENVTGSDGTLIFNFGVRDSPGTMLARGAAIVASRPVLVCRYVIGSGWDVTPARVVDWICGHRIATLHVGGNRESELDAARPIYAKVRLYLRVVFDMLQTKGPA